jgi:hypothetical protein
LLLSTRRSSHRVALGRSTRWRWIHVIVKWIHSADFIHTSITSLEYTGNKQGVKKDEDAVKEETMKPSISAARHFTSTLVASV